MSDIYKVLIIPDLHVPSQDTKTLKVVEKFMADHRWDEYVNLGDLMDFDSISRFNAEMFRKLEGKRLLKEYDAANEILDRHQEIVRAKNKQAKFTLLEGNHDYRMEVLIDKAPQFEGMLEVEKNLRLPERGFKWVKSWSKGEMHQIGKLYFAHGMYITKYHAAKMAENYGINIAYGHTHDVMSYEKTTRGNLNPIMAMSLGYLADPSKLTYMRNRPNNWSQCIGVAEIRADGNFNLTPIRIINHQFTYAGVTYK